jgi:hypothetical protein
MESRKVLRYYSDCGRGFWKKHKAITHDENCKCWKNPKFKTCISCKHKCMMLDSNGMEGEPQHLQTWEFNNCEHSESGTPVHKDYLHIRKYCQHHELLTSKNINN